MIRVPAAALACLVGLSACDPAESPCAGARIQPSLTAIDFGDRMARSADDPGDPLDPRRVPVRRTLLLQNTCGAPLTLRQICILNDRHNQIPGQRTFSLEGPDRTRVGPGDVAGLRITYDHPEPNADLDQDGVRDLDQAILVVQSDAQNAPTLVLPLCGRILPEGETAEPAPCPPPFSVPAGQALDDLCEI